MKFKFKIQQYQTDAVTNTVAVFTGQPSRDKAVRYRHDVGKHDGRFIPEDEEIGWRNADIEVSSKQFLAITTPLQYQRSSNTLRYCSVAQTRRGLRRRDA